MNILSDQKQFGKTNKMMLNSKARAGLDVWCACSVGNCQMHVMKLFSREKKLYMNF